MAVFCLFLRGMCLRDGVCSHAAEKFVNRGLVNGPFCVLYGITSVLMTVGLQELDGYICISASAFWGALGFVVVRWGIAAETSWQEWMDVHYDDAKMAQIYPNAKAVE